MSAPRVVQFLQDRCRAEPQKYGRPWGGRDVGPWLGVAHAVQPGPAAVFNSGQFPGASSLPEPRAADRADLVAASLLSLGSDTRPQRLFADLMSAARANEGSRRALSERLAEALWREPAVRTARTAAARQRARYAVQRADAAGFAISSWLDPSYPGLLRHLPDPPILLWYLGRLEALGRPAVALVGSRRASSEGLAMATRLGRDLARAGLVVVSGLARGIDAAAHRGALQAGGVTVAVLGSGLDWIYPREHGDLARQAACEGCVLSEFPPGTPPLGRHFPLRNRVISGLSRAVVVVEAAERSGSLITARLALEQGRDVLAVPGSAVSGCYRGCHALIKDGARLVETADDVLDEIGWTGARSPGEGAGLHDCQPLTGQDLLSHLAIGEPTGLEALAVRTGRLVGDLLAELGGLEVAGQVARLPDGRFVRLD